MQEPRLTKEQFVDRFEEQIRESFPDCVISRKEIQKPHSVLTSLVIQKPGCEAAPSIRIDDYWSAYQDAFDYETEEKRLFERLRGSLEEGFSAVENGRIAEVAKDAMANWRSNVQCLLMMKEGNEQYNSEIEESIKRIEAEGLNNGKKGASDDGQFVIY